MSRSTRRSAIRCQPSHQHVVVYAVEELLQVHVHHEAAAFLHVGVALARTASCARRPRPEAVARSEKVGSNIGCKTCSRACWMKRSSTVGMPSFRTPPPLFGIASRLTG